MKFIADSMLGRLAKWLRILGYDTLYHPAVEDSVLLRIAREEGRTILTRDTRLIRTRGLKNFIFIHNDYPEEQLKQLFKEGVIKESLLSTTLLSRCVHCNTVLYSFPSEKAEGSVPDFVLWKSEAVKRCPSCGKIYWKGTHPEKIKDSLMKLISLNKGP